MRLSRILITASLVFTTACAHQQSTPAAAPRTMPADATALSSRDAAVLEAALRYRLRRADANKTIFISVGSIAPEWKDPPPVFLNRLKDLPYRFKPASQARMP